MLQSAPSTANPRNSPRIRVGEGRADRVLMVGNGVLHGWGVRLRELSAPGHLAGLLHRETGRAVALELVGEERMNAASAVDWMGDAATRGHDLAVVCVGLNDALRLTPLPEWRGHMTRLLDRLRADQGPDARILLVGLPHVRRFTMADSAMGSVAQRHADEMDLILQQLAYGGRTSYVAAPRERFEPDRPLGSSAMYEDWAAQLLPAVLSELETVRRMRPPLPVPADSWDWSGTKTALEADGTPAMQRLEDLTEQVRRHFGVALAGVNVLDGSDVHSIAGKGGGPRMMPRSLAYCDRTVREDAVTMIEDADADPEFAGNPFLDVVDLPFYAGVPLHALDGRAVATLCVLDTDPRATFDLERLQQFARDAERELQQFEPAAADEEIRSAPHDSQVAPAPAGPGVRALAVLLKPVITTALGFYLRRQQRPEWDGRAVVSGPDPIRVLVVGGGLAVGYGTSGEDDPLPRRLGEELAAITGRGVIVETRAQASLRLVDTPALLGVSGAATFDHVVWSPTLEEAARSSASGWGRHLRRIVLTLRSTGSPDLSVLLLGVPLVHGPHPLHPVGQAMGAAINARTAAVADAFDRTTYLPVAPVTVPTIDTPLFDSAYRAASTRVIAQALTTTSAVQTEQLLA